MASTSTSSPRLLMIEDDRSARESVSAALSQMGYSVLGRPTGEELDEVLLSFRPDLAIIDINLPSGPDGFALARHVRASAGIPVLFLTAADGLESRLSGFEAGGDDYLVSPSPWPSSWLASGLCSGAAVASGRPSWRSATWSSTRRPRRR